MLRPSFFNNSVTDPHLQACGNTPVSKDLYAMLLNIIIENSVAHDFSSDIDIALSGDIFIGATWINRLTSSKVT